MKLSISTSYFLYREDGTEENFRVHTGPHEVTPSNSIKFLLDVHEEKVGTAERRLLKEELHVPSEVDEDKVLDAIENGTVGKQLETEIK